MHFKIGSPHTSTNLVWRLVHVLAVFCSCRWPETATFVLLLDTVLLLMTVAFCTHCSEPALCTETHSLELHVWLRGRLFLLCEIGTDEI